MRTDWESWADCGWCPAYDQPRYVLEHCGFDELCAAQGCATCTASAWENPYDPVHCLIERQRAEREGPAETTRGIPL